MASSMMILNVDTNYSERLRESKRKKIKNNHNQNHQNQTNKWKSQKEQQIYSSKLLEALRRVHRNDSSSSSSDSAAAETSNSSPPSGQSFREAADRALAVVAKGRTRWSRAILTHNNRLIRLKFKKKKVKSRGVVTGICRSLSSLKQKQGVVNVLPLKMKSRRRSPALQRTVRVLGRLVPGCRKISFPDLLEEATDYIAAMEMQVRTMTALSQLLSVVGPSPQLLRIIG